MTGIACPAMIMAVGITIETSRWTVIQREVQLMADLAAFAGVNTYNATLDMQTAATIAAQVAELNGATPGTTRTWNSNTKVLTDGSITVTIGAGLRNSSNTSFKVQVTQTVPLIMAQLLTSGTTTNISGYAWAELSRAQPCLLALGPKGGGVMLQGNPSLTLSGCSVRSNNTISTGGSATISAPSLWARSTISGSGITGTLHPNSGIVPDPYAADAPVIMAFNTLSPGSGAAFSNQPNRTNSLNPGTYSSWNIGGRVNLAAGIYYVNGAINLGDQSTLSGTGVTIVTSGTLSLSGGAAINLTAPTTNASGGIPGVVFAGNSTAASGFGGSTAALVTGVVYYPQGSLSFNGTPQGGSSGCLEVIAYEITMLGNSSMSDQCGGYGALSFGDASALGLVK